jgi:DnaK suppressor protein
MAGKATMKKPVKKAAKKAVAASKAKKAAPAAKKAKPVPAKKIAKVPEKKPLKAVAPVKKPAPAPAKKEDPKKTVPVAAKAGMKKEVQDKVVAGKAAAGKGALKAPQGATKAPAPLKIEPKLIETPEPEFVRPANQVDLFSQEELSTFKTLLESERGKILAKARRAVEEGNIMIDKNDLMDEVDQASAMVEQNLTFRLLDRDRKLLSEIDHAIAKLDSGDYGYCEGTGEPIPKRRLELRPWCRHSVKYKEKLERMKKSGRGVVDEDEL